MRHRPKHTKRNKPHFDLWIMRIAAVIGCLTIISAYLLSNVFAKFSTTANGSDSARVAKFVLNGEMSDKLSVPLSIKPGDTEKYSFTVTNTNGSSTAEVSMKYSIDVSSYDNLPLIMEIYDSNKNKVADDAVFTMEAGKETTHNYTLEVTWDENRKESNLVNEIDMVKIVVNAEQLD